MGVRGKGSFQKVDTMPSGVFGQLERGGDADQRSGFRVSFRREDLKRIDRELPMTANYGEGVRNLDQTVQDLLQNHIDAAAHKFIIEKLGPSLLEMNSSEIQEALEDEERKDKLKEFLWMSYLYWWVHPAMSPEDQQESLEFLAELAEGLPVREELRDGKSDKVDPNALDEIIKGLVFDKPEIDYKLYDWEGNRYLRVKIEDLDSIRYPPDRYVIVEVRIHDAGKGYDPSLLAVFFSKKGDLPWSIGQFGEGAKMAAREIQRAGGDVVFRSVPSKKGEGVREIWQVRLRTYGKSHDEELVSDPRFAPVRARGVSTAVDDKVPSGSCTIVRLPLKLEGRSGRDERPLEGLRARFDPRMGFDSVVGFFRDLQLRKEGLKGWYFPFSLKKMKDQGLTPVLICPDCGGELRVWGMRFDTTYFKPDMAYNFLSLPEGMLGRDRDKVSGYELLELVEKIVTNSGEGFLKRLLTLALRGEGRRALSESGLEMGVLNSVISHCIGRPLEESGCVRFMETAREILGLTPQEYFLLISSREAKENKPLLEYIKQLGGNFRVLPAPSHLVDSLTAYFLIRGYKVTASLSEMLRTLLVEGRNSQERLRLGEVLKVRAANILREIGVEIPESLLREITVVPFAHVEGVDPLIRPYAGPLFVDVEYWGDTAPVVVASVLLGLLEDKDVDIDLALLRAQRALLSRIDDAAKEMVPDAGVSEEVQREVNGLIMEYFTLLYERIKGREISTVDFRHEDFQAILRSRIPRELWDKLRGCGYSASRECGILSEIVPRAFVWEDGTLHMLSWRDGEPTSVELGEHNRLGSWKGHPVYGFTVGEDAYIFIKWEFKKDTVITDGVKKIVFDGDYVVEFRKFGGIQPYSVLNMGFTGLWAVAGDGILVRSYPHVLGEEEWWKAEIAGVLKEVEIYEGGRVDPFRNSAYPSRIETGIPIEYGIKHWPPWRLWAELVQNAIAEGGVASMRLYFKIKREGEEVWVSGDELREGEKIEGVRIENPGSYHPLMLKWLGAGSKSPNPLIPGRFGEGAKLALSYCLFHGLLVRLGSEHGNQRWVATASTREEEFGEKLAKLLTLDVEYNDVPEGDVPVSFVEILPGEDIPFEEWENFVEPVDPRREEEGLYGIERFVLLERDYDEAFRLPGGVWVLRRPQRRGQIFVNGILVPRAGKESYLFGYSLPSDVIDRDRERVDVGKIRDYLGYVLAWAPVELVESFVRKIKGAIRGNKLEVEGLPGDFSYGANVTLLEVGGKKTFPSLSFWREALMDHLSVSAVYSEDDLWHKYAERVKEGKGSLEERLEILRALSDLDHFKGFALNVPPRLYHSFFKHVLPSAQDLLSDKGRVFVPQEKVPLEIQSRIQALLNVSLKLLSSDSIRAAVRRIGGDEMLIRYAENLRAMLERNDLVRYFVSYFSGDLGEWKREKQEIYLNLWITLTNSSSVVKVIMHELLHALTGLKDYTPEFLAIHMEVLRVLREMTRRKNKQG